MSSTCFLRGNNQTLDIQVSLLVYSLHSFLLLKQHDTDVTFTSNSQWILPKILKINAQFQNHRLSQEQRVMPYVRLKSVWNFYCIRIYFFRLDKIEQSPIFERCLFHCSWNRLMTWKGKQNTTEITWIFLSNIPYSWR